jgi:hypothetical protein
LKGAYFGLAKPTRHDQAGKDPPCACSLPTFYALPETTTHQGRFDNSIIPTYPFSIVRLAQSRPILQSTTCDRCMALIAPFFTIRRTKPCRCPCHIPDAAQAQPRDDVVGVYKAGDHVFRQVRESNVRHAGRSEAVGTDTATRRKAGRRYRSGGPWISPGLRCISITEL